MTDGVHARHNCRKLPFMFTQAIRSICGTITAVDQRMRAGLTILFVIYDVAIWSTVVVG